MRLCRSGELHTSFSAVPRRGTFEVAKDQLEIEVRPPNREFAPNYLNAMRVSARLQQELTRYDGKTLSVSEQQHPRHLFTGDH